LPTPPERIRTLCARHGTRAVWCFAWKHLSGVLCYAAERLLKLPTMSSPIDDAIEAGPITGSLGPFEIWDALGVRETADRLKERRPVPVSGNLSRTFLAAGEHFLLRATQRTSRFSSTSKAANYVVEPESPQKRSISLASAQSQQGRCAATREPACSTWEMVLRLSGVPHQDECHRRRPIGDARPSHWRRSARTSSAWSIGNQGPHFSAAAQIS